MPRNQKGTIGKASCSELCSGKTTQRANPPFRLFPLVPHQAPTPPHYGRHGTEALYQAKDARGASPLLQTEEKQQHKKRFCSACHSVKKQIRTLSVKTKTPRKRTRNPSRAPPSHKKIKPKQTAQGCAWPSNVHAAYLVRHEDVQVRVQRLKPAPLLGGVPLRPQGAGGAALFRLGEDTRQVLPQRRAVVEPRCVLFSVRSRRVDSFHQSITCWRNRRNINGATSIPHMSSMPKIGDILDSWTGSTHAHTLVILLVCRLD